MVIRIRIGIIRIGFGCGCGCGCGGGKGGSDHLGIFGSLPDALRELDSMLDHVFHLNGDIFCLRQKRRVGSLQSIHLRL